MKKIINTFKYGTLKVKCILLLTFFVGMAAIGLAISAIILGRLILFFCSVISIFITLSLAQTFVIHEAEKTDKVDKTEKTDKTERTDKADKVAKTDKNEEIDKNKDKNSARKKKHGKNKTCKDDKPPIEHIAKENDEPKPEPAAAEDIASYNKKKLKKTMHKYKVKKDHRMAIIDRCDSLSIYQTPAFIWVQDNQLHMLLIEKEPRHITLPVYGLNEITYMKKIPCNEDTDYAVFKNKNMITELFREYLPDYTHSTVIDDLTTYKNLYGIGPGVFFTNRSAAHLFDLLGISFYVDDKVTASRKVNTFFKDSYKANILLRDNVIDANGYADRISNILGDMAKSTISHNEFRDTLNLMIKNKLITQEFAQYYTDLRNKVLS